MPVKPVRSATPLQSKASPSVKPREPGPSPAAALWSLALGERVIVGAGLLLMLIGILSFGWSAWGGGRSDTAAAKQGHFIQLAVSGRLVLPATTDIEQVQAHVRIPEIPLDLFRRGHELLVDKKGHFSITTRVQVSNIPSVFSLTAEVPGVGRAELADLRFVVDPDGSEGTKLSYCFDDVKLSPLKPGLSHSVPAPTH